MIRKKFTDTSPKIERTYADEVLCTALDIGEGMLKCGAEIRRVEDTIERICRAYGAEHCEVFSLTSLITSAIRMPDGEYSSQIRRVYNSSNNFRVLEDLNALSREICRDTPATEIVQERLREIKKNKGSRYLYPWLGGVIAAVGFTAFFGGNWLDSIVAGAIGLLISILGDTVLGRVSVVARTLINSLVAGMLAEAMVQLVPSLHSDTIMIGTIMLLVPGIAFGNSLRDLFSGDTFAGSARLVQSVLLALTIAFGFSVAIVLLGGVI